MNDLSCFRLLKSVVTEARVPVSPDAAKEWFAWQMQ